MSRIVGFIGLGNMGEGMARSLLRSGFVLRLHNRSVEKARRFAGENAVTVCATPAEAVRRVTTVITMVSDDEALAEVTLGKDGILEGLGPGGLHLSASTVSPEISRRLASLHEAKGSYYLATPVFGRPLAAAAAKLHLLLSGGDLERRNSVRPVLQALGQSIWDFGDDPGAANIVKVCGNFMAFAATEAMAEAFTLAQKEGLDRRAVYEMLTSTLFDTPAYKAYGLMVAEEQYEPVGFSLPLGLKDLRLFAELGRQGGTPLPLADLIDQRMETSLDKGRGHQDAAVFAREVSEAAGLPWIPPPGKAPIPRPGG